MSGTRRESVISGKRLSKWEAILRKFSESQKIECKSVPIEMPRVHRSVKHFPTGSEYEGTWDVLGMSGQGTYIFPNGVIYVGEFEDGMFHGHGELRYQNGVVLRGKWKHGVMSERRLFFADDLEYDDHDWDYCRMPDRRFTVEYKHGLQPAGEEFLTADQPTPEIPPGLYDTGDGFYDPNKKIIYKTDDLYSILRSPCAMEQKWIVDNCRTNPEHPVGPRPDLYKDWTEPELELSHPKKPFHSLQKQASGFQSDARIYDEDKMMESLQSWTRYLRSSMNAADKTREFYFTPLPDSASMILETQSIVVEPCEAAENCVEANRSTIA